MDEQSQSQLPIVSGFEVERLLGAGGQAEVWLANGGDGLPVALKLLPAGASGRELEALTRQRHPHLVRLHAVTEAADGRHALVLDYLAGGSLAQLVSARGELDPGEVVTIVTPVAQLLAQLHADGIVHGDVTPGNILFGQDGRPMLCDLGVATVAGLEPRTAGTDGFGIDAGDGPGADIYGLGACAWFALTGAAPLSGALRPPLAATHPHLPLALIEVLEDCLHADPNRRPTATDLAQRAFDATTAQAVDLVAVDPQVPPLQAVTGRLRRRETADWELMVSPEARAQQPPSAAEEVAEQSAVRRFDRQRLRRSVPEPTRRRPSRRWVVAVVVMSGLIMGGVAAKLWSDSQTPGHAVAASTPADAPPQPTDPADTDPADVETADAETADVETADAATAGEVLAAVEAISQRRAEALTAADREGLDAVDAPGSPALAADLRILDQLHEQGIRFSGLSFQLADQEVVAVDEATATVRVTTSTTAHHLLDDAGGVLAAVPAGVPQRVQVTLTRSGGDWLVREVVAG